MAAILNLAILDSATLVFPLNLTHICQDWFPPFAQKKLHSFILTQLDDGSHLEFYHVGLRNFTHSFWLNLMMAAILNSATLGSDTAILDSDTLFSSLRFTQKHSHSTLTLTQTNSVWLKLIHTHSTWWWQPSWIWPSWIQPPYFFLSNYLTLARIGSHHLHKKEYTQSFWLNLMMAATLNSTMLDSDIAILDSDTFLFFSQIHSKTLSLHSDSWLKLIQSHSNLFILTQLYDGSHLEFCHLEFGHLGFSHLSVSSQTHSHLPRLVPTICTKKPSLIHSDSTWWWQPSWILSCWIQTPCFLLPDSLKNTLTPLWLWLKLI